MGRGQAYAGASHQGSDSAGRQRWLNNVARQNGFDVACSRDSRSAALPRSIRTKVQPVEDALRQVQLRPTCPRVALALLLMKMRDQVMSADTIYEASYRMHWQLPRSTVTAALRRFAQVGLLQRVETANSRKLWFSVSPEFVRRFGHVGSQ